MNIPINYVRLQRTKTDSWITYRLPKPMLWKDEETYEALMDFLVLNMPGWELISGSINNPDEEHKKV